MRYLIRQEQKAALERALGKIEKAKPGEIVGLTEREMQAWTDKIPFYEYHDSEMDTLLADVPDPKAEEKVMRKGKVIRLFRRTVHDPNLWTAGKWEKDTPEYRTALEKVVKEYNSDVDMAAKWIYSIDERETYDDENC